MTLGSPSHTRWWPFPPRKEAPLSGDVVAMRFDDAAIAADLARWCDGRVVLTEDLEGVLRTAVYVPTRKGPRPAQLGDWIVMQPDGGFQPCTSEEFAARYEPQ